MFTAVVWGVRLTRGVGVWYVFEEVKGVGLHLLVFRFEGSSELSGLISGCRGLKAFGLWGVGPRGVMFM